MVAPRKTAVKRAPAKTAAPQAEKVDAFKEYWLRARNGNSAARRRPDALVLGPDKGFDPPVAIALPTMLESIDDLDLALRHGNNLEVLRILLGSEYRRVFAMFDKYASTENIDPIELLDLLSEEVQEHFFGPGSTDVAGGSRAS